MHDVGALTGQELTGPLLADGGTYTWLVTDGWVLSTDARGDASLTRKPDPEAGPVMSTDMNTGMTRLHSASTSTPTWILSAGTATTADRT